VRPPSLLHTAAAFAGFLVLAAGAPAAGPPPVRESLEKAVRAFPGILGISARNLDVRTDAAYVKSPKARYVIAICARRVKDKSPTVDNQALVTGARMSRMVYDYFNAAR
jgi:hypothetical protein